MHRIIALMVHPVLFLSQVPSRVSSLIATSTRKGGRDIVIQVRQVMSNEVQTVSPDDTIQKAASLMSDIDCGSLPVAENDRLAGVVTDRDIALRAVAKGKAPNQCKVREVMSQGVKYVFEDEDTESASENMSRLQVRRLPVLNRQKRLVGIVALGDLATKQDGPVAGTALRGISRTSTHPA